MKPLARIFCVTRDEYDLIEDFVAHHGRLFGFENIHLLDNRSTDLRVLAAYERFRQKGVVIQEVESYAGREQGLNFTRAMREHKNSAEFLIGLDTDEFIFSRQALVKGEDPISIESVRAALLSLPPAATIFEIADFPFSKVDPSSPVYAEGKVSRPAAEITTFYRERSYVTKIFYRGSAFVETLNGNHDGVVAFGGWALSGIGYLHFSNSGAVRSFERAAKAMDGYNYFNINSSLPDLVDRSAGLSFNIGIHRVQEFRRGVLRDFIFGLFVEILRRFPRLEELSFHEKDKWRRRAGDIRKEFETCAEAREAPARQPLDCEAVAAARLRLVFPDPPLDGSEISHTFLRESLLKLAK